MRRIIMPACGPSGPRDAAWVLDTTGVVLAVVAEPVDVMDGQVLRDAVVAEVLDADFGETVLAGVVFAAHWGGDAIGFT